MTLWKTGKISSEDLGFLCQNLTFTIFFLHYQYQERELSYLFIDILFTWPLSNFPKLAKFGTLTKHKTEKGKLSKHHPFCDVE